MAFDKTPVIPYKYTVEMICDTLAAGKTYQGKNWDKSYQLKYWENEQKHVCMNENIKKILTEVYTQVSQNGINKTLNWKNLRSIYLKFTQTTK